MSISKSEAQTYMERWSMVRDAAGAELRAMPMDIKVKQLASLMESRALFAADPKREQEASEVRARWALLRQVLSG